MQKVGTPIAALVSQKLPALAAVPVSFECASDGLFEDPRDCQMYFECLWVGTEYARQEHVRCDQQLIYNPRRHRCDEIAHYEEQFADGVQSGDELLDFMRYRNCMLRARDLKQSSDREAGRRFSTSLPPTTTTTTSLNSSNQTTNNIRKASDAANDHESFHVRRLLSIDQDQENDEDEELDDGENNSIDGIQTRSAGNDAKSASVSRRTDELLNQIQAKLIYGYLNNSSVASLLASKILEDESNSPLLSAIERPLRLVKYLPRINQTEETLNRLLSHIDTKHIDRLLNRYFLNETTRRHTFQITSTTTTATATTTTTTTKPPPPVTTNIWMTQPSEQPSRHRNDYERLRITPADTLIECKENDFGLECSCSITLSPPRCKQLINAFLSSCRVLGCQNNGRCINMTYKYPSK